MNPFSRKHRGMMPPAPGSEPKEAAPAKPPMAEEKTAKPETSGKQISPEMVCFRTSEEVCANCEHMQNDGQCFILEMPVDGGDSCNVYRHKEQGAADMPMEMDAQ